MRYPFAFLATAFVLLAFAGDAVLAQTASVTPSKRVQLQQDNDECAKQVDRKRVDLFAECMNKKQDERKAAARQKKAEEKAARKQHSIERFNTAMQAHREANLKKLEHEKAERAKMAGKGTEAPPREADALHRELHGQPVAGRSSGLSPRSGHDRHSPP
ncbi:MAG TPA: hypothetical protein VKP52_13140 [Pseudolabrys sp.]|nr:hypothetical protein [Pseudolabrys sp.]